MINKDVILFVRWATIEYVAGALMLPATVSIVSGTYSGEKRTIALAIVGVMGAIASAIGPLFGGVMTTFFSWRHGFACELLIVVVILVLQNKILHFEPTESKSELDITAIISFIGLVLLVFGILSLSVLQLNAFDSGLTTLPLTMDLLIFSLLAPKLSEKLSHKKLMAIGSIMSIIGCLILSYQFKLNTGNINDVKEDSTVMGIVDTIIQNAMGFVMIVTAILMAIVFVLTL